MSALTPRWPLRIIVTRLTGTPSAFDTALADSPSSSSSSRRISPGCTASCRSSRSCQCSSVIIHDLDIARFTARLRPHRWTRPGYAHPKPCGRARDAGGDPQSSPRR